MLDKLFILFQFIAPQHWLSRCVGWVANNTHPALKNRLIRAFIRKYNVNMAEARDPDPEHYDHFNQFFTRPLRPDARTIVADANTLACPVDGAVSQLGDISHGQIFQAKGRQFSLIDLLGGNLTRAEPFQGGRFATIYLSPRDYHRIHMPLDATLKEMVYIPGRLFSVNPLTTREVDGLFARNERVACIFDTEHGPMAMVLVGAMIVASIETVWAGEVAPVRRRIQTTRYGDNASTAPITLKKGEEMGRFKLGSTVVLLFGKEMMDWQASLAADQPVQLGQALGELTATTN